MNGIKKLNKGIILSSLAVFALFFVQCSKSQQHQPAASLQAQMQTPTGKMHEIANRDAQQLERAKENKVKIRSRYAAFYLKNGSLSPQRTLTEKVYFDSKGRRSEQVRYRSSGDVDLRWIFDYDANGNIVVMTTKDGTGQTVAVRKSEFDKNNNETLRIITEANVPGEKKTEFKYDKDNNVIQIKEYDSKGRFLQTIDYEYANGFLMKVTNTNSDGRVTSVTTKEYNSDGYLIKETTKVNGGEVDATFGYDSKGNLIEAGKDNMKRTYKYDDKNNMIEDKLIDATGAIQFNIHFTYLPSGLQHEEIRHTATGEPAFNAEYRYEFY